MSILEEPPRYRTYLLTLWEERGQDSCEPRVWRFSLEDPRTGQRRGYANPESLVAALVQEVGGRSGESSETQEDEWP